MNNYTDAQLKQALAKMLSQKLEWYHLGDGVWELKLKHYPFGFERAVLDTELLHLCWLLEGSFGGIDSSRYCEILQTVAEQALNRDYKLSEWFRGKFVCAHATWQQRTIALAKVKGIEIT